MDTIWQGDVILQMNSKDMKTLQRGGDQPCHMLSDKAVRIDRLINRHGDFSVLLGRSHGIKNFH